MNYITPARITQATDADIDCCNICGDDMAVEDGFCEACWEQHVGQFGVGA